MARPIKRGLDYFSVDCHLDDKVLYLEAKHGLIGYAILVKLWAKIYKSEGYFCDWKEKNIYLFCKEISAELTLVNDVVNTCFEEGIFHKEMYDRHKILTSKGIQKRWHKIVTEAKRKDTEIEPIFTLLEFAPPKTPLTPEETRVSKRKPRAKSTQSKVKKSKVKDITIPDGFGERWEKFNSWFTEQQFEYVPKIENQITPKELMELLDKASATVVKDKLLHIENSKDKYTKHKSVYLTLLNWINRDNNG